MQALTATLNPFLLLQLKLILADLAWMSKRILHPHVSFPLVMDANCKTEGRMVVRLHLHVERASLVSNQYQLVRCLKLTLK
jgi:hypothetical protein